MDLVHINVWSVTVRLLMATAIGGVIGFEREKQHQAAGLRTHMLICIGAALAMLTNQYVVEKLFPNADATRIGAQVISGIGFMGVGTIVVTQKQKVKGLTTAAGLWASACAGLAAGIGFYSGALIGAAIIFVVIVIIQRFDRYAQIRYKIFYLNIEIKNPTVMEKIKTVLENKNIEIKDIEFSRIMYEKESSVEVNLKLKQNGCVGYVEVINALMNLEEVIFVTRVS